MIDAFVYNTIFVVAVAGIFVSLLNIYTAVFLGAWAIWLVALTVFVTQLTQLKSHDMYSILSEMGNCIILLILLGFYLFFCLLKNKQYIMDKTMPSSWYTFSYYTMIMAFLNVMFLIDYAKNKDEGSASNIIIGNTLLFGFVLIETIICTSFRTDGFTL